MTRKILLTNLIALMFSGVVFATSAAYTSPGTYMFTVPSNITTLEVVVVGGGGGGGGAVHDGDAHEGSGGGSGGYNTQTITVTPGQTIPIVVGAGGCGGHFWYVGSPVGGTCVGSPTYWAGGTGEQSSFGGIAATGGTGGSVGGGAWYWYGLDPWVSSPGFGGTPNGTGGSSGHTFSCYHGGGSPGNNGSGYGTGGRGGSCSGGQPGTSGAVIISWYESPCVSPWGSTTSSGGSVTAYRESSVNAPTVCESEVRTCTSGSLSGSYTNPSCVVRSGSISSLSSCTIALGASTCTVPVQWTSTYLSAPALVDENVGATLSTSATQGAPGMTTWIAYPQTTLTLKDGTEIFDTKVITASCGTGLAWSPVLSRCIDAPTATISALPTNSDYNERSTLTWSSTNADTCYPGGAWSNGGSLSGSGLTDPLTATQSFTYYCSKDGADSPLATATVTVCPSTTPLYRDGTCNALPRVTSVTIGGQYTDNGSLDVVCTDADYFEVYKDGVLFRTVMATSGTVAITDSANYTVICVADTDQNSYDSAQSVVAYSNTPPPPVVRLQSSPTTLSVGDQAVLSWDVTYPGSVQEPPRTCTLTASAVCANGSCTPDQTAEAATLNTLVSTGRTDSNDTGGGNRLISTALNTVVNGNVTTGDTDWRAFGKKTLVIRKTTDFLLFCGGGANESSQIRVRVTTSNER